MSSNDRTPTRIPLPHEDQDTPVTRRRLIEGAAGMVGAALVAGLPASVPAQGGTPGTGPLRPAPGQNAQRTSALRNALQGTARREGTPTSAIGMRSPFAQPRGRAPTGVTVGSSLTPLQDLTGTITPADLHFERHHAGVPAIDPATHKLMIHGLVERPLVVTVDEIRRLPSVTRMHFVECSGNGRGAWRSPRPDMTAQQVDGLTSNSEWTGVPLATLFREAGVHAEARWFLAEGGDACLLARSVPIEKAWDDALVVWAQNGEPLRPEQGFPLRLLLPGWEGNTNVKWLRRIELGRVPWMTRWETAKYTDPLADGTARIFSLDMDAKSIITSPSHGMRLTANGWYPITGLAWSGRGRITRVEVSVDGGTRWRDADLQQPTLPKAHTRFDFTWRWPGDEAVLLSRATDETGSVQPTRSQLVAARGIGTDYHFNCIRGWRIDPDGSVAFHWET